MRVSQLPFSRLQSVLVDLGFVERVVDGKYRGFYHAHSDTLFVLRKYAPQDDVTLADLASVRNQLAWRGLLTEDAFDASLSKVSA
jgi:hypothetical protein